MCLDFYLSFLTRFLASIMDKTPGWDTLPNFRQFRVPQIMFSPPPPPALPHFYVVYDVTLSKRSWINCKLQRKTWSGGGGRGELNILYPLISLVPPSGKLSSQPRGKLAGMYSEDLEVLADAFNKLFVSHFGWRKCSIRVHRACYLRLIYKPERLVDSIPPLCTPETPAEDPLPLWQVTTNEVSKLIKAILSNKAPGHDKVSVRVIKDC